MAPLHNSADQRSDTSRSRASLRSSRGRGFVTSTITPTHSFKSRDLLWSRHALCSGMRNCFGIWQQHQYPTQVAGSLHHADAQEGFLSQNIVRTLLWPMQQGQGAVLNQVTFCMLCKGPQWMT